MLYIYLACLYDLTHGWVKLVRVEAVVHWQRGSYRERMGNGKLLMPSQIMTSASSHADGLTKILENGRRFEQPSMCV